MTVSTSFAREFQVQDLIRRAYQMAGLKMPVHRSGAGIDSNEMAMARDFLEFRIDELQTKATGDRFRLWGTKTLTPNVSGVNLDTDAIDVEGVASTYLNATDIRVPCLPVTHEVYWSNPAVSVTTGRPIQYYVNRAIAATTRVYPTVYFWPIPDQAYTFRYRYVRFTRDVDLDSVTVDLEPYWSRWLVLALAADLAEASNKPTDHVARLEGKAQQSEKAARDYSRPHGAMQIRLAHRGPWR